MLPSTMEKFSILTVCDFPSPILLLIWQNLNSLYFRTEWLLSLLFFLQPGVHFLKTVSKLPKSFRARRGFFKNSFLTIIAQFLCRSRATHFSISQGFQSLQSTFIKNHIFCSWTLLLSQPTQSNPQRKQSGNKSNGIESLGPSYLLSFLSFLSALSQKKMPGRRKTGKNAPILSHEFVITNHGDIVSCICMVFMMGLMFQVRFSLFGGVV